MKSFYEILEVPESASTAEIHSAYKRLAREYHPDRVPDYLTKLRADAEERFKQLNEAWAVLGDPGKRKKYDLRNQLSNSQATLSADFTSQDLAKPATVSRDHAIKDSVRSTLARRNDRLKLAVLVATMTIAFVLIGRLFVPHAAATHPLPGASFASITGSPASMRQYNAPPRHIQTSQLGGGGGLQVQLLSVAERSNEVEVSFRVRAGGHSDLLLYEPPGARYLTRSIFGREVKPDRDFEEIYMQDNTGAKFYSTSGIVGGEQVSFNLYNFTRRINFRAHEDIVLSAKFPPLTKSSSSIAFCSPAIGSWQPEWRWSAIELK